MLTILFLSLLMALGLALWVVPPKDEKLDIKRFLDELQAIFWGGESREHTLAVSDHTEARTNPYRNEA
jgi:hypothetical protein